MADGAAMADDQAFLDRQLTILLVDDNLTWLKDLEAKLLECKHHVISTNSAMEALKILRANEVKIDIVITEVHMPDMDGFGLLEQVGPEMDLPCIMVSGDDDPKTVMKGIQYGACDYLLKPVRIQELRTIWKHILRKEKVNKVSENHSDNATSDSSNENVEARKRKGHEGEEEDEGDREVPKKKRKMVWTQELHSKFVEAVKTLGAYEAFPKKILTVMKVEGLTREHVASHLQKYRKCMRKVERKANMMGLQSHLPLLLYDQQNTMGSQSHLPLLQYCQQNTMGSQSHLPLLQHCQQNTLGPHSHLPLLEYRQENTMGPKSPLPLHQSSQGNTTGPQNHLPLLQSSEQNMVLANTNTDQGLPRPWAPYPITNLGSRFHHRISSNQIQAGSSSLSTRLPQFRSNNSASFSQNPVHSFNAVNTLSTTSGLSPRATLNASSSDYSPLNYPLIHSLESLNINTNMSNFSGTNQGLLNFNSRNFVTSASQGHSATQNFPLSRGMESLNINTNTNNFSGMNQGSLNVNSGIFMSGRSQGLNTAPNFDSGNFVLSGNSQNRMLDNAMDCSVIPEQRFMFDTENQFESGDDTFRENSSTLGVPDLDDLLNLEELDAWLPDNDQDPNP